MGTTLALQCWIAKSGLLVCRAQSYTGWMDSLSSSDSLVADMPVPPAARIMGHINWIGLWTLLMKEIRRFMKVYLQTVAAPVMTTLLYYLVFAVAMSSTGGSANPVGQVQLFTFLAPGLIMMGMSQNAFANTSSSVMIAKVQGNIVDVLMTPISPVELALALVLGGIARGLVVGVATALAIDLLIPVRIHDFVAVFGFAVLANMMLALLGVIGAIWADKFDHIAAVTNFIVMPLTFLSGTFYSVDRFRPALRTIAHFNPFFYMIDGFRYGFIGHADAPLLLGAAVLVAVNLALWAVVLRMLISGYKLKS
jgi:ABC-2 type transport system permease protein